MLSSAFLFGLVALSTASGAPEEAERRAASAAGPQEGPPLHVRWSEYAVLGRGQKVRLGYHTGVGVRLDRAVVTASRRSVRIDLYEREIRPGLPEVAISLFSCAEVSLKKPLGRRKLLGGDERTTNSRHLSRRKCPRPPIVYKRKQSAG